LKAIGCIGIRKKKKLKGKGQKFSPRRGSVPGYCVIRVEDRIYIFMQLGGKEKRQWTRKKQGGGGTYRSFIMVRKINRETFSMGDPEKKTKKKKSRERKGGEALRKSQKT